MALHLSDIIPAATLRQYLPDDTLLGIESDHCLSIYSYACGCTAMRQVDANECFIRWCELHQWDRGGPRTV